MVDVHQFFTPLRWVDRSPLLEHIEPYRLSIFSRAFNELDDDGRPRYDLILCGRAKKNWKSADLALACFYAVLVDSPGGNEVYIIANDEDQAGDDLSLCKALLRANPVLAEHLTAKRNIIERKDGLGFIEILPAQDAIGQHGKTYRLLAVDEVHGYRTYDLLEALAPDPTRRDAQQWITSYASIYHRPGVPLFDFCRSGRAATDPRMLFSWYAADFTTDPDFAEKTPEDRANPSRASWGHPGYLAQQQRRLPAHKYRRLHLNLPGLPEGSAFQPEPVMDAIARGVAVRPPARSVAYVAFVDMSGGSSDDAVLAIAHRDADGRGVLDCLVDQGPRPPFDPSAAVTRFVDVLGEYRCNSVTGDRYAGETFRTQFEQAGVSYRVSDRTRSELYEALEPLLNARVLVLLDAQQLGAAVLEQQLLGLVWRGGKIDHQSGEHDDFANAAAGALVRAMASASDLTEEELAEIDRINGEAEIDNPLSLAAMKGL